MTEKPEKGELHELAGGWITERVGMPIPGFLKLAYIFFGLFGIYYLFAYWKGDVAHATRGPLVKEINEVMVSPGGPWLGFLAVVLILFVAGLWLFVFRPGKDESQG